MPTSDSAGASSRYPRLQLPSPAWLKSPFVLVRFSGILVAVFASAVVLGLASASSAPFLSSAGNEAIAQELAAIDEVAAGLNIEAAGPMIEDSYHYVDDAIARAAERIDGLERSDATVMTSGMTMTMPGAPGDESRVRLLYRGGALDNIDKLRGSGEGFWVPQGVARSLGVKPGDRATVAVGDATATIDVAGIYEDLSSGPLPPFWRPMTFELQSISANQPTPPPPLIAGVDLVFAAGTQALNDARYGWRLPLEERRMTLERAESLVDDYEQLSLSLRGQDRELGRRVNEINISFGGAVVDSSLPEAVERVRETIVAVEGPVGLLSLAGRVVALIVLAAAGLFSVQRRRVEVRLLAAQGVGPVAQGTRGMVESVLVASLGAVAGWALAVWLVRTVGPTELITVGVTRGALGTALRSIAVGVLLIGVVTALAVRREADLGSARLRGVVARFPWEAVVLALAAASLYEIVTRGAAVVDVPDGPPEIDVFVLLFPILFVAGMAGLASRGLRRLLPLARRRGERSSPAVYLALRRLAGASRIALLLVTACSIALGIFVYASILVSSSRATAFAKASVSVGSGVAIPLASDDAVPGLSFPSTVVTRADDGEIEPAGVAVDTLGIDPETFASAAFFDPSFADESLDELLSRLQPYDGERLTAIVAGGVDIPDGSVYVTPRYDVPIEVVGTAEAWPGLTTERPLLVAPKDALVTAGEAQGSSIPEALIAQSELWADAGLNEAFAELRDSDAIFNSFSARATDQILSTPTFLALSWTFGYLQALGVAAGLIALVGLLLYLQTRQRAREVSYALARRMGLTKGAHRAAVALELGGMLVLSLAIGAALAWISSFLIFGRLDPLPEVPPAPLFRVPSELLFALVPVILGCALVGAWRVQRKADSANVAEVLRYAG